jgi:hypothetical protein
MSIDAVALLKRSSLRDIPLEPSSIPGFAQPRVLEHVLDDCILFHTHVNFGDDPEAHAVALRRLLGEHLDAHVDARGIFCLPDVAVDQARALKSYDAVIEGIGELGMWVPIVSADFIPQQWQNNPLMSLLSRGAEGEEIDHEALQGAMQSMMASLRQQTDSSSEQAFDDATDPALAAASPLAQGGLMEMLNDPALMALASQLMGAMPAFSDTDSSDENPLDDDDDDFRDEGTDPELAATDTSVEGDMPPDLGAMMSSPAFAQLLAQAQEAIAKNPEHARALAARFGFAGAPNETANAANASDPSDETDERDSE